MGLIRILVCCHKEENIPNCSLFMPIQAGASLAERHFDGFMHDDVGENISQKNKSYCELTALYWAWKNVDAEYYGLFHYRRYLYPKVNARRPYKICGTPTEKLLGRMGYGSFETLIGKYEFIMPLAEDMHVSVREHYAKAQYHHRSDLALIESIVRKKHPEMSAAMETYFSGTKCYFGNICIMHRDVFNDYCAWLFPILEEFDQRADTDGYNVQEKRVDGYLAERLLGVYYTYRKHELRTLELPRVHFESDKTARFKKTVLNFLLPPGSRQRAIAKKHKIKRGY